MPSRRLARELALQSLFGIEVGHRTADEMLLETCGSKESEERTFIKGLVLGTLDSTAESDAIIAPLLEGWTLDRLPTIDRLVLRMAAFELAYWTTPPPVVINEAVELAKKFSTEDSGRFVNGVLSNVARSLAERAAAP